MKFVVFMLAMSPAFVLCCNPARQSQFPVRLPQGVVQQSNLEQQQHFTTGPQLARQPVIDHSQLICTATPVAAIIPNSQSKVPNEVFLHALAVGETNVDNKVSRRMSSQESVPAGTASAAHTKLQQPKRGVAEINRFAQIAMEAARNLQAGGFLFTGNKSPPAGNLRGTALFNCYPPVSCDPDRRWRSNNGSCNNLLRPILGQVLTPLHRVLPNAYADGLDRPRGDKGQLPSARFASTRVVGSTESASSEWTALLMAFGQFVDHDLTHVPIHVEADGASGINCCTGDGRFDASSFSPACFPIRLPKNDPMGKECMNFVRSQTAPRLDCQPGPSEQINQITHWLDSSNVYGSSDRDAAELRTFSGGLLKFSTSSFGTELLPLDASSSSRFLAGDDRLNEQPYLALIHIIFFREHNRLARELRQINPFWDDEMLFQESRRILNAEWQHIIYSEFLSVLLGPSYLTACGLAPLDSGFQSDYSADIDPTVANEFAAAAFRIGHTMVPSFIHFIAAFGRPQGEALLRDMFQNVNALKSPGGVDSLVLGLTQSPMENVDDNFSQEILNHLFKDNGGLDLIALNIQRGRDHGLPGYIEYLKFCSNRLVASFDDLREVITPDKISRLASVYKRVEDIDLFVGMSLETPGFQDGLAGPTFRCLIGDQFARLKRGDRFFYDHGGQAGSFTIAQLNEIRHSSMARLLCDNSDDIQQMQRFAFELPNAQFNPIDSCKGESIPRVRLDAWADEAVEAFGTQPPTDTFFGGDLLQQQNI